MIDYVNNPNYNLELKLNVPFNYCMESVCSFVLFFCSSQQIITFLLFLFFSVLVGWSRIMFYSHFSVLYSPSDFTEPAEETEGGVRSRILGFTIVSSGGSDLRPLFPC